MLLPDHHLARCDCLINQQTACRVGPVWKHIAAIAAAAVAANIEVEQKSSTWVEQGWQGGGDVGTGCTWVDLGDAGEHSEGPAHIQQQQQQQQQHS